MMERSDGVDHDHPPLPHDMKGVSTVPIGGAVGQDLVPILAATVKVMVVIAMQENITKNQNEEAKVKVVKNGADHPAKGKANTTKAAVVVTVGKIRRRKRSRNEVIDRRRIDQNRHHLLRAVGMTMIQM